MGVVWWLRSSWEALGIGAELDVTALPQCVLLVKRTKGGCKLQVVQMWTWTPSTHGTLMPLEIQRQAGLGSVRGVQLEIQFRFMVMPFLTQGI